MPIELMPPKLLSPAISQWIALGVRALSRAIEIKNPPMIGLDIGSSSIKMVVLEKKGPREFQLERYVIEPLPEGAVTEGNINELSIVGDRIKRAYKRLGSGLTSVAIALPFSDVITKRTLFSNILKEEQIEQQIPLEVGQYIPFPLEESNFDFQVLGPSRDSPGDVDVMIAAARREKLEDRVAAVEAAGLKALVVDVDLFALQSIYALTKPIDEKTNWGEVENIALVKVGAWRMSIHIIREGFSIYQREQPFGGAQLTQEIQSYFELPEAKAESAKRDGTLPESYVNKILMPFLQNLGEEVARSIQYFYSTSEYNQVHSIVLVGGCAALAQAASVVQTQTMIPTSVAKVFNALTVSDKVPVHTLNRDASSLFVACGLALRGFD
jgi:type IV pilus assembly protein PilM